MNSLSDLVALKRIDMETIQRQKRGQTTPRVVTCDHNCQRPNVYFPNINRTFMTDMTCQPGQVVTRQAHQNSINRESSITFDNGISNIQQKPVQKEVIDEVSVQSMPVANPVLDVNKPLGLLQREYKHPLSMYEENTEENKKPKTQYWDPTLPRQYYEVMSGPLYEDRPPTAGKEWVTNRWNMWSGSSPATPY